MQLLMKKDQNTKYVRLAKALAFQVFETLNTFFEHTTFKKLWKLLELESMTFYIKNSYTYRRVDGYRMFGDRC